MIRIAGKTATSDDGGLQHSNTLATDKFSVLV